ncbi:MAG TPA: alpha-L-arabinofuranosidase C-terminal domain-containing protein [Mobilitalea sp.]|nr:alpha-L-arabinofuranosidase C-terminal domain-containing protein [Mobilitalea sp.]
MSMQKLHVEKKKGVPISPGMIGLFYEDINYCCDGGLNAEMIENPAFEFVEAMGSNDRYSTKFDGLYGWIPFPSTGDDASLSIGTMNPFHENNPHYLQFKASRSQLGITNKAFEGIHLKAGASYIISAYLRSSSYTGKVTVSVYDKEQAVLSADLAVFVTDTWVKYEIKVTSEMNLRHGRFVIAITEAASLEVDFVSMKPANAVCGVFRSDIADTLKDMQPGFLRFPGGCIVEGNELSNRYRWKNTVGPLEARIPNWNRWAVHNNSRDDFSAGPYSHYNQTYAIGYYEYFMLCEYIGAKPLPVQNVGLACQYQTSQLVETNTPEFQEFIDDVLDLIEFANGSTDSQWGSLRAKMGHPKPFHLEMIGIGNEQWETERVNFFERYTIFEKVIHDKYTDIKLIGSAGPDVTSEHYTDAWDFYKMKQNEQPDFTYAVDEHYYRPVEWLYENNHFYDNYPRNVKVFAGEYAAHIRSGFNMPEVNTLEAGLSEAAFLTGVERNADVVVLASYAPLFARVGFAQWSPNLIWFDDHVCYGTPSYYVQKLYAGNMGNYTVINTLSQDTSCLYQTVSYDERAGELIIKLINSSSDLQEVQFDIDEAYQAAAQVKATILTSVNKDDHNNINEPDKVKPYEKVLTLTGMTYQAPAHSFSVIRVPVEF